LSPEQGETVLQFARFLSQQAPDGAWEKSLATAAGSARFPHELADVDHELAEPSPTPLS
jgi:hypothetical protein